MTETVREDLSERDTRVGLIPEQQFIAEQRFDEMVSVMKGKTTSLLASLRTEFAKLEAVL